MASKQEIIAGCVAGVGAVTALSFTFFPDQSKETLGAPIEAAQKVIEPDIPSSTESAPSPEQPACIDIATVDPLVKIGSLVLVMAEPTQFDVLRQTMESEKISNFALTTNTPLTDQVSYLGQMLPIAEVTNGIKSEVGTAIGVNKITFALDEEGGNVQRTKTLSGFQEIPSASEQDPTQITNTFTAHGETLKTLGVTLVFGPVTDVNQGGVIGKRSYGGSVEEVTNEAGSVIDGLHAAGIDATLKHYPGYGSITEDAHDKPGPTVDFATLQATELPAFAQLITTRTPAAVMVSHGSTEGLTDGQPASLSPKTYDLLENTQGFQGVKITDALDMGAVLVPLGYEKGSVEGQAVAAVAAVQAGADTVIIGLNAADAVTTALKAVPQDRINDAATKVFEQKGYDIC